MGREIKRVPLGFDWPVGKKWDGYVPPQWRECPNPDCENGSTVAGRWVEAIIYPLLMLDDSDRGRGLHPWLQAVPLRPDRPPSSDIKAFCTALAGRESSFLGHDACDRWHALMVIVRAAGLPDDYFTCKVCGGHAVHPDDLAASEAWTRTEPPAGEGWQVWETVSEGSPITPVFATREELVEHLVTVGAWEQKWDRAAAEAFTADGWAPSMVASPATGVVQPHEAAMWEKP